MSGPLPPGQPTPRIFTGTTGIGAASVLTIPDNTLVSLQFVSVAVIADVNVANREVGVLLAPVPTANLLIAWNASQPAGTTETYAGVPGFDAATVTKIGNSGDEVHYMGIPSLMFLPGSTITAVFTNLQVGDINIVTMTGLAWTIG